MDIRFEGKVALVTGAAGGIGRAIALAFARAGATVVVVDIDADGAEAVAIEASKLGARAHAFELDVSDRSAARTVAGAVAETVGPVAYLINNAGLQRRAGLDEPDAGAVWDSVMAVTLGGAFNVTHAFRDQVVTGRGAIVNIASVMSCIGAARQSAYASAKAGIVNFTRSLSAELAPHGIRVNALAPGLIETGMTRDLMSDADRLGAIMPRISIGRHGTPDEVAGPALFLCSPLASYITGATLRVDGGWLAR